MERLPNEVITLQVSKKITLRSLREQHPSSIDFTFSLGSQSQTHDSLLHLSNDFQNIYRFQVQSPILFGLSLQCMLQSSTSCLI